MGCKYIHVHVAYVYIAILSLQSKVHVLLIGLAHGCPFCTLGHALNVSLCFLISRKTRNLQFHKLFLFYDKFKLLSVNHKSRK